jgi:hypothetical protein
MSQQWFRAPNDRDVFYGTVCMAYKPHGGGWAYFTSFDEGQPTVPREVFEAIERAVMSSTRKASTGDLAARANELLALTRSVE